ncbi:MAG: RNA polymerase sigma factor [Sorangiineae bacterium]|nr:RNA polymerase sigma factor [Polyangiaceae bacterium]MEB2325107.1 RNA polymerase sigma factor [Sorangiineae bacterium]
MSSPVFAAALALDFPPESSDNAGTVSVERELIARALDGDGRAFASLVEPHLAMLFRIAARACGDRALAEDAVQEALTIGYEQLGRYQPDTSLKAFLAAIAVRKAHTLLRTERRRRAREDASAAPEALPDPAELLAAEQTAERIRVALAAMPKKRREAALLRLDAGMSYDEIARAVGSTEGSTRVLVHLALKELRERLGEEP